MKTDAVRDENVAEYLDMEGAAALMGVSKETVKPMFKAWKESGGKVGIPHAIFGAKLVRTTREDVRRFYENQKKNTAARGGRGGAE